MTGIEPVSKAWEAFILPLNYTRKKFSKIFCEARLAKSETARTNPSGGKRGFPLWKNPLKFCATFKQLIALFYFGVF